MEETDAPARFIHMQAKILAYSGNEDRLRCSCCVCLAAALQPGAASAQLLPAPSLPPLGGVVDDRSARTAGELVDDAGRAPTDARDRSRGLADGAHRSARGPGPRHPDRLEMTDCGPAVRGEVIAIDPDPATLRAARAAGFAAREERIDGRSA